MSKTIVYYIIGGLLGIALIVYVAYLLSFLVGELSVASRADLLREPEIATFNLEKFKQIKITP